MTLDRCAGRRLPSRVTGKESLPSTEVDLIWYIFWERPSKSSLAFRGLLPEGLSSQAGNVFRFSDWLKETCRSINLTFKLDQSESKVPNQLSPPGSLGVNKKRQ